MDFNGRAISPQGARGYLDEKFRYAVIDCINLMLISNFSDSKITLTSRNIVNSLLNDGEFSEEVAIRLLKDNARYLEEQYEAEGWRDVTSNYPDSLGGVQNNPHFVFTA